MLLMCIIALIDIPQLNHRHLLLGLFADSSRPLIHAGDGRIGRHKHGPFRAVMVGRMRFPALVMVMMVLMSGVEMVLGLRFDLVRDELD